MTKFKMVPVEPTDAMLDRLHATSSWRRILDAAPSPYRPVTEPPSEDGWYLWKGMGGNHYALLHWHGSSWQGSADRAAQIDANNGAGEYCEVPR